MPPETIQAAIDRLLAMDETTMRLYGITPVNFGDWKRYEPKRPKVKNAPLEISKSDEQRDEDSRDYLP